jgi:capsular exopolysaccharide synthesis family protein
MNDQVHGLMVRHEQGRAAAQMPPQQAATYAAYSVEDNAGPSVGSILAILRRRLNLIVGVAAAVCAVGAAYTLMQTPSYSATALLMVNPNPEQIVPEKTALNNNRPDAGLIDSEIEVLKSPSLAARLAGELDLDRDPEWNPALRPGHEFAASPAAKTASATPANSPLAGLSSPAGDAAQIVPATTNLMTAPAAATPPRLAPDDVVANVAEAIDVRRRGISNVIEIEADSRNPAKAAQMANGLAELYLKTLSEARYDGSQKANEWLKDRLGELKAEVLNKQAAASAYKAQRNLLTAQGMSLVETQLAEVQSSLLRTRSEFAQKQAEYSQLNDVSKRGETVAAFSSNSGSDSMQGLRARSADAAQKVADLSKRYGPAYPALQQAKEEQASIDAQVADEMTRIANKAKIEMSSLGARMETQEREMTSLRSELVNSNFDQVKLEALETDAQAAQSVYESFLQRYHEVARQGSIAGVGARILSPARAPGMPTSPHILFNGAITLAAAFALAILTGLLAEQFRGTIETTEEVERRVGARALVAIPELRRSHLRRLPKRERNPAGYLVTKRMSPYAESLRVLHASILLSNQPQDKVVAITSAMPGDGKTTISVGLSRIAALGGQKVIVVDCDLRMRQINKVLGIAPTEGLQHVLSGEMAWQDVVGVDKASGAHVLPAAEGTFTSKDMFGSGTMEKLIQELSQTYDLVVLDCAPVFAVADTRLITSLADTTVIAARSRKTPAKALAATIAQLEIAGARILGVALNRVDARGGRRSFYDGLYYSKAFSGYYAKE